MSSKTKSRITAVAGVLLITAYMNHLAGFELARNLLLLGATIVAGFPIIIKAIQTLRMRAFSIELLVTIAIIGAIIIGEYVESAVVSFLFLFGAFLEARTLEKTRLSLKLLMDMAPLDATVKRNEVNIVVPIHEVLVGDRVIIHSGEKVSVDGIVVAGSAYINQSAITGESLPVNKKITDHVYSGTIVDHGYIEVIAEKISDDTAYSRIIALVEEAQESKTKTEQFLERFAQIYTPAILVLSIVVYLFTRDIALTLTFLVIACPGALVISAPVSIIAGIGNGAKNGVLIKGGEIMEKLAKVNTIVFDKTGTLTIGQPKVTEVKAFRRNEDDLLKLVAEVEAVSEHHIGQTIVKEARARNIRLNHKPEQVEVIKGRGIQARVAQQKLVIGNRKLMEENEIMISDEVDAYLVEREQQGNTAIMIAINTQIEGVISIADPIRPEAAAAIRSLRKAGIQQFYLLTGDNRHTAALVAAKLGIDHVFAERLPEDKAVIVRQLQDKGLRVVMAGDGINDAPAIAIADVGLAMGISGTDVTMETADVVLMADKLDQFAHAYLLAKVTIRNMKQNTFFAVGTVVFLLIAVLFQKVFLATGMLVHEMSVLIVILNALRLVQYKSKTAYSIPQSCPDCLRQVEQWGIH